MSKHTLKSASREARAARIAWHGPLIKGVNGAAFFPCADDPLDTSKCLETINANQTRLQRFVRRALRLNWWVFEARIIPAAGQTLNELCDVIAERKYHSMKYAVRDGDVAVSVCGLAGLSYAASEALGDALAVLDRSVGGAEVGPWAVCVRRLDLPRPRVLAPGSGSHE